MDLKSKIILIYGPTASGKSKFAVELAKKIYLYLAAIFITSLVVSNLIFQKFISWHPFDVEILGNKLFELSVGILPYPITFLVTDLISEIYGKKKANQVVTAGIFASLFSLLILTVADFLPAIQNSPIDDSTFKLVFSKSLIAVSASMASYLLAQFVDIKIYHFWKNLTKVKTVPYKHNYGYFFTSGPESWHGMEKKEIKKERRCIQVNYVTFPTDWKVC